MIEFKRKFSMHNGKKVTKKNWNKVVAISTRPCTNVLGYSVIEEVKKMNGAYYETWKLVFEKHDEPERAGYIFREVTHGGGINGMHKTFKEAIWWALSHDDIRVMLEE